MPISIDAKLIRVISINVVILGLLLSLTNGISALILKQQIKMNNHLSLMLELPNYPDTSVTKALFWEDREKLRTVYQPFTGWTRKEFSGKYISIDKDGYRSHEHHMDDSRDTETVAFFGGSTIWGYGSIDEQTIPAFVDFLNDQYVTHNYGEAGYNARQGLARLSNLYIENHDFDLVVFYDGVNEIAAACNKSNTPSGHMREGVFRSRLEKKYDTDRGNPIIVACKYIFTENTVKLLRSWRKRATRDYGSNYDCVGNSERAYAVARNLVETWKIAKELVEIRGGVFLAILQPNAFIGSPNLTHIEGTSLIRTYLSKDHELIYDLVRNMVKEEGLDWVYDFTEAFNSPEYIYIDDVHTSANGNLIIAEKISELLNVEAQGE